MHADVGGAPLGQSATCSREPAKPPMRVWTSHRPEPGADHHVGPLQGARVAGAADLDDGHGRARVAPRPAGCHEDGEGFADDARAGREVERVRDLVRAVVEEDDLAGRRGRHDGGLDGLRVVRRAIAFGASAADAVERAGGQRLVLRLGPRVEPAMVANEPARPLRRREATLPRLRAAGRVPVTLAPGHHRRRAACQNRVVAGTCDGDWDVGERNVLEDQAAGSGGRRRRRPRRSDEDGAVSNGAVDDDDGAHVLGSRSAIVHGKRRRRSRRWRGWNTASPSSRFEKCPRRRQICADCAS